MPIRDDVILGKGARIFFPDLVNLYGCRIDDETSIGPFVEIQSDVSIGARCKVSSHAFICSGVTICDEVFIGHGVMFTNDKYPVAAVDGRVAGVDDWTLLPTVIEKGVSIGSGATIMCGIVIGQGAIVGAGAVVVNDVLPGQTVVGNPAKPRKKP